MFLHVIPIWKYTYFSKAFLLLFACPEFWFSLIFLILCISSRKDLSPLWQKNVFKVNCFIFGNILIIMICEVLFKTHIYRLKITYALLLVSTISVIPQVYNFCRSSCIKQPSCLPENLSSAFTILKCELLTWTISVCTTGLFADDRQLF